MAGRVRVAETSGRRSLTVKRPRHWCRSVGNWPSLVQLKFTLPCALTRTESSENRARATITAEVARLTTAAHSARTGKARAFQGAVAVLKQRHSDRATSATAVTSRNPRFSTAGDKSATQRALGELREFFNRYRTSLRSWRAGQKRAAFPTGTWWMVQFHAATIGEAASSRAPPSARLAS